ncbi:MAG TPA: hypothetical protein VGB49_07210 [Caulobacteraceae bacterium]
MNAKADLNALSADVAALQGVVRALTLVQARRSRTALCELLQALSAEAAGLADDDACAAAMIEAWVEVLKDEAIAA